MHVFYLLVFLVTIYQACAVPLRDRTFNTLTSAANHASNLHPSTIKSPLLRHALSLNLTVSPESLRIVSAASAHLAIKAFEKVDTADAPKFSLKLVDEWTEQRLLFTSRRNIMTMADVMTAMSYLHQLTKLKPADVKKIGEKLVSAESEVQPEAVHGGQSQVQKQPFNHDSEAWQLAGPTVLTMIAWSFGHKYEHDHTFNLKTWAMIFNLSKDAQKTAAVQKDLRSLEREFLYLVDHKLDRPTEALLMANFPELIEDLNRQSSNSGAGPSSGSPSSNKRPASGPAPGDTGSSKKNKQTK